MSFLLYQAMWNSTPQKLTPKVILPIIVWLSEKQDMYYKDPLADPPLEINLKKGTQKLSGEQAMHFIRYRSDELGDAGRAQRQQRFL